MILLLRKIAFYILAVHVAWLAMGFLVGNMGRPDSSRTAAIALNDSAVVVRAEATRAILSLPPEEAVPLLVPLLRDRAEFVRREAAYALGLLRSRAATGPLITALASDKEAGVRGAAAVSLGLIRDESAVVPLAQVFQRRTPRRSGLLRKVRSETAENDFVRRSAARSLGQIGSRAAVPALVALLSNEKAGDDVRREAALALGAIGDPSAAPALRAVLRATDPYLSRIAFEILRKMQRTGADRRRAMRRVRVEVWGQLFGRFFGETVKREGIPQDLLCSGGSDICFTGSRLRGRRCFPDRFPG
jgi:HEAT repeat protein